jgi:hypothetical protein
MLHTRVARSVSISLASIFLLLSNSMLLTAQTSDQACGVPTLSVDARLVNIPVVVRDKSCTDLRSDPRRAESAIQAGLHA